jgi:carbamoyl-phosphate synthase large subunit
MPKRTDIQSILLIGAGPIVIGQACEFDYSGTQACKALREEGYRVILVNSNPATIMTDPETADAVYIEPVEWRTVAKIIERERPDAILPTMGGQTALNCALDLDREGVLAKFNVEMIGARKEVIDKAEDREKFRDAMTKIGLSTPRSIMAHSMEEAITVLNDIDFPLIIRPSFTMGGSGGGIAYNREEFTEICTRGLDLSPTNELLIEESVLGWKEYEMEVVRDCKDNCIIICSIENFDPMGVHTGDSITIAPALTLTDKEYQIMRNASLAVLREIGVDTGGSNVQFAINPDDGRMIVIEMNPRVSRSSALASKATGFPIAKVAAKLAVGYTLDELDNDITGGYTPASFEPSIDYIVTKIPRFAFEKFPNADATLTTQMKSVGEVMAMGRTFKESLQKAMRGLEIGVSGFDERVTPNLSKDEQKELFRKKLRVPNAGRLWYIADAMRAGYSIEDIFELTAIDRWFLRQIEEIIHAESDLQQQTLEALDADTLRHFKRLGFSDRRMAKLLASDEDMLRTRRHELGVHPVYKRVDTCAGEFPGTTAYMYSTYEEECESLPSDKTKMMVLGGGPNRIGQGLEFDYCCVHAALAMREDGYESIMVNCNPETVSTDYDTSDRLYFEPLTREDVLEIIRVEQPKGVIVQYGGQTPLNLAPELERHGVPIIGTSPDSIDLAEDRERFQQLIHDLGLLQPANAIARNVEDAVARAEEIGYPLVVRPSFVLGGRAMAIVHFEEDLCRYYKEEMQTTDGNPLLLDKFLDHAVEIDVDAVCDGTDVLVGGIMQHIEQAGVHSGDSACSLPPYDLSETIQQQIRAQVKDLALALKVVGLMNVQFAVQEDRIYILEVNPRASRTVPFVSKAVGHPLAKIAARCMAGVSLQEQGITDIPRPRHFSSKEAVFPFVKFPGVDPVLSPEMKSTGEVMGIADSFGAAFAKSQSAAGNVLPTEGTVFLSLKNADKPYLIAIGQALVSHGFTIIGTSGTVKHLQDANIACDKVNKVNEGRPHIVDMIKNNKVQLIINTSEGKKAVSDSYSIRREALNNKVSYFTTIAGAKAFVAALNYLNDNAVRSLKELG